MGQAEFARHRGVSKAVVTKWKGQGLLVMTHDGKVDVEASEWNLDQRPANYRGGTTHRPVRSVPQDEKPAGKPARPAPSPRPALSQPVNEEDGSDSVEFDPDNPNLPLNLAAQRKENYLGLLRKQDHAVKQGALIDRAAAEAAFFEEARATLGNTAVIVPWGDWLVAVARMAVEIMLPLILPVIAAAVLQAIYKVYPWAALVLSQRRVEQMGQALAEYGLNAVEGAAKGKTLSVDVASRVVATGVQYGIDRGAPRAIRAAGGPEGVAKLIFRLLDIDESASAEKVIPRALIQAGVVPADQPVTLSR